MEYTYTQSSQRLKKLFKDFNFTYVGKFKKTKYNPQGKGNRKRNIKEGDLIVSYLPESAELELLAGSGRLVYCLVHQNQAHDFYIGKAEYDFRLRSKWYEDGLRNKSAGSTNSKIAQLAFSFPFDVYVHIPEKISYINGVVIDPTESLERTMIETYNPAYNSQFKIKDKQRTKVTDAIRKKVLHG